MLLPQHFFFSLTPFLFLLPSFLCLSFFRFSYPFPFPNPTYSSQHSLRPLLLPFPQISFSSFPSFHFTFTSFYLSFSLLSFVALPSSASHPFILLFFSCSLPSGFLLIQPLISFVLLLPSYIFLCPFLTLPLPPAPSLSLPKPSLPSPAFPLPSILLFPSTVTSGLPAIIFWTQEILSLLALPLIPRCHVLPIYFPAIISDLLPLPSLFLLCFLFLSHMPAHLVPSLFSVSPTTILNSSDLSLLLLQPLLISIPQNLYILPHIFKFLPLFSQHSSVLLHFFQSLSLSLPASFYVKLTFPKSSLSLLKNLPFLCYNELHHQQSLSIPFTHSPTPPSHPPSYTTPTHKTSVRPPRLLLGPPTVYPSRVILR